MKPLLSRYLHCRRLKVATGDFQMMYQRMDHNILHQLEWNYMLKRFEAADMKMITSPLLEHQEKILQIYFKLTFLTIFWMRIPRRLKGYLPRRLKGSKSLSVTPNASSIIVIVTVIVRTSTSTVSTIAKASSYRFSFWNRTCTSWTCSCFDTGIRTSY